MRIGHYKAKINYASNSSNIKNENENENEGRDDKDDGA